MSSRAREDEYIPEDDNPTEVQQVPSDKYTVDEAIEIIGFGRAQIKLSLMAGVVWMADAMELTLLSIISPEVRCMWKLSSWQEAFITTIVFVGMGVSSAWWGRICDSHGRRVGLLLTAVWTTYFGFLSGLAPGYHWLLILRALTGFGIGGAPQSVTLYSEFLPVKSRARCIMAVEVFWAIGTVLEVFLALIIMPTLGFRWLLIISAVPLLVVVLAAKWMPESPRYHLMQGRVDLAQKTLENIAAQNGKRLPAGGLKASANSAPTKPGQISDLFKTPELKKTTLLLWLIWFQCAFAYYGLVLLSTSLFQQQSTVDPDGTCPADFTEECDMSCKTLTGDDYMDLLWVTLSEFPGLVFTLMLMEVMGRKQTMALTYGRVPIRQNKSPINYFVNSFFFRLNLNHLPPFRFRCRLGLSPDCPLSNYANFLSFHSQSLDQWWLPGKLRLHTRSLPNRSAGARTRQLQWVRTAWSFVDSVRCASFG